MCVRAAPRRPRPSAPQSPRFLHSCRDLYARYIYIRPADVYMCERSLLVPRRTFPIQERESERDYLVYIKRKKQERKKKREKRDYAYSFVSGGFSFRNFHPPVARYRRNVILNLFESFFRVSSPITTEGFALVTYKR
ncbi:uncharacterized protein LOC143154222 [Ptiloglossa arizonensis]|uniref:uncharacterized protein LOC143154222 n=1 Tax=Ptiloglossa arizonensis TaxID=3350558 RepID=UPI003F9F735A